ncbi:MAG: hypothetical protein HZA90_16580 [Verrucomicrobia bacterium]|nr:hypothetical protein [Verrucomicrobiota bacterium]
MGGQTFGTHTYESVTGWAPQDGSTVVRVNPVTQSWDGYVFTNGDWNPSAPILREGEAAFFCVPCNTNPCLTLVCPTNKAVGADTNWSFDTPAIFTPCCGTNFTFTILDTRTNGPAWSQSITRYWQVIDCSNNIATCRQTVTLREPAPLLSPKLDDGILRLSWPASHAGWRLEVLTNGLTSGRNTNWLTLPGSTNTSQMTLPVHPASGAVFYRLASP